MISKTALKTELGLDSTSPITSILKAAGRPYSTQRVEDADADLVRKAMPQVNAGKSFAEAVKIAIAQLRGEPHEEKDPAVNGTTPPNGTITIHQLTQLQNTQLTKQQEGQVKKAITTKAIDLAEKAQSALWIGTAAAMGSSQVQNSERVTAARDFALGVISGTLGEDSMETELTGYAAELGFFGDFLDANLLMSATVESEIPFSSPEPYFSPNGSSEAAAWQ